MDIANPDYFSSSDREEVEQELSDATAIAVFRECLPPLEVMIRRAENEGSTRFRCWLHFGYLSLWLSFRRDTDDWQHTARLPIKKYYKRLGEHLDLQTAVALRNAVCHLVLRTRKFHRVERFAPFQPRYDV